MSWLLIFFLMRSAGPEVRYINRGQMSARLANKLAEKKPFQPPLQGTQKEVNPDGPSDSEDNLGKRHASAMSLHGPVAWWADGTSTRQTHHRDSNRTSVRPVPPTR